MTFRPFQMDGALLLSDRDSNENVLFDGFETASLRPRGCRMDL
jgi:hypothetical protein